MSITLELKFFKYERIIIIRTKSPRYYEDQKKKCIGSCSANYKDLHNLKNKQGEKTQKGKQARESTELEAYCS